MSNPWIIDEADFYELETHQEQMTFLLRYAILAPSGHNTQPWTFRITADGVEVMADYSRRLPVVDGNDRELLMSVGAAIANFRVAAAHFGFDTTVAYEPRTLERVPVATIRVCETCAPNDALATLFPAIRKRHTNRELYDGQPIDPETLQAILDVVDANPSALRLVLPRDVERVVEALASAERTLMARPAYRAELADSPLPPEALGIPSVLSGVTPWLIRTFDVGDLQARRDSERTRSASMLVVVTAGDDRVSLLKAGEVLEILLLTITAAGLQYSFLNAAVEVKESRDDLRMLVGSTHPPQILLRIGSAATAAHPTPRRAVENVIVG
ncbi:MAG TPA: nitroreductase family protein [Thermoanaerobaculia bacterium]